MQKLLIAFALLMVASCGRADENKRGNSDDAIQASCQKQAEVIAQNHLPYPKGMTAGEFLQSCANGARRYRDEVSKPAKSPVTPATNR